MNLIAPICDFSPPQYWLFSENIPSLVYYSHFSSIVISLILAFLIFYNKRKDLSGKLLLFVILPFVSWVALDSIFWASNNANIIMFVWSLQILIEPLSYLASVYLIYVLIRGVDISFNHKILLSSLYVPLIILTPTNFFLPAFNLSECLSIETIWSYYTYIIEALSVIWIALFIIREHSNATSQNKKEEILYVGTGVVLFLLFFASGNIIGSLTGRWDIAQVGLIGSPILISLLSYAIVRFNTFKIKLLGTQVLVVTLWITLSTILFIRTIENVRIVVSLTLMLFLVVGTLLVRSVKKEVQQRERIEKLAKDLEVANEKLRELDVMKSEFLSLASHQIRSPLTAMKGYSSMLIEGDYGPIPVRAKEAVHAIFASSQNLISIVNDFLDISRIEQGRMIYQKDTFDLIAVVRDVVISLEPNIKKAGLDVVIDVPKNFEAKIVGDESKIRQVMSNLLDNAVKYTIKGSIVISSHIVYGKVRIEIKDTGMGLEKEEIEKLFTKFMRMKDAYRTNVTGTGLGLYIAKKMVEAHGGNIGADSKGKGTGSTFWFELPTVN